MGRAAIRSVALANVYIQFRVTNKGRECIYITQNNLEMLPKNDLRRNVNDPKSLRGKSKMIRSSYLSFLGRSLLILSE